jgi:hypothetical protein
MHHVPMAADFSRRVFRQQPLRMASAIGQDAIKLFAVQRVTFPGDTSVTRWQFQRAFPLYPPYITDTHGHLRFAQLNPAGKVKVIAKGRRFRDQPAVNPGLAGFLRAYQRGGGYTPGPLFLFTVLAGLAGTIGVLRRQAPAAQRATATACLLTFLSAAAVLLASDLFEFSWRYQLPALVTLAPAGALGITVLIGYVAGRRPPASPQAPRQASQPASGPGIGTYSGSCQPGRGPNRADANHTTTASGTSSTTGSSAGT